jgi:hypothetical protein
VKQRFGIKDRPKCETSIEKIDGCDYMTCRGCGTHEMHGQDYSDATSSHGSGYQLVPMVDESKPTRNH